MDKKISNPLNEIDAVLKSFAANPEVFCVKDVVSFLENKTMYLSKTNVSQMLIKLEKDGYLMQDKNSDELGYDITFEGRMFLIQGGYEGQFERDNSESDRMASIEHHQSRMAAATLYVNRWIMRGTLGAAAFSLLYLIWTILAWLYDHHYPSIRELLGI